jgi:hypothetical protein
MKQKNRSVSPGKHRVGQLALTVPLQEVDFRDTQGFTRAAMTGNNVNGEIVPRGCSARRDNARGDKPPMALMKCSSDHGLV